MKDCSFNSVGFSAEEIQNAVKNNRLLSLEIEMSLVCNFHCPYCYVPDKSYTAQELTRDEIMDTVIQAKALGAKRIIILGGEPSIYSDVIEIISSIRDMGLEVEMFTNGSGIDGTFARNLHELQVRVVLKMNTFDRALQDRLAGKKGAYEIIHSALSNLQEAGYPSSNAFLGVSSIICRQNIDELPEMWQWLRDREIVPYFEMITPQANAKNNEWLFPDPEEVHGLFVKIAEIDRVRYGNNWSIQPPIIGNRCMRHKFSCLVTSTGTLFPCVGVTIPIGNVREQQLADIIANSEVLHNLKNHTKTIKGNCRACKKAETCYGCRGAAYQLTGDYLASDPLCWNNRM